MPSTGVRLTAGRQEKGFKKGVPWREGIFFRRSDLGHPGLGWGGLDPPRIRGSSDPTGKSDASP